MIDGCGISCEIALGWIWLDLTYDESTLVQVMAWCHQAASHYLSRCWPRSMSPYGITRSQWVNMQDCSFVIFFLQNAHDRWPINWWFMKCIKNQIWSIIYLFIFLTINDHAHSSGFLVFCSWWSGAGQIYSYHSGLLRRHWGSQSMRPVNERRRYIVTMSLIGWTHA